MLYYLCEQSARPDSYPPLFSTLSSWPVRHAASDASCTDRGTTSGVYDGDGGGGEGCYGGRLREGKAGGDADY